MVKKVIMLSCLLSASVQFVSAQNVLKGRVVDTKGNPISGAKVENAKGAEQTTTDMNGEFSLETEGNVKKVNVYYMGMQTAHKKAKPDMLVKMGGISWWKQKPDKYRWFVAPQVAIVETDNQPAGALKPSFGFMFGRVKNWGWYAKGVYSSMPDNDGSTEQNRWFTGDVKQGYALASVGVIRRLFSPLQFYTGIGYGWRRVAWKTPDGSVCRYDADSHDGIAWDLGMQLRIKHVVLNVGANFIYNNEAEGTMLNRMVDHYPVGNFGIGYVF